MKVKNVFVEIIEGGENKRYYIVRSISGPNQPADTLGVFESADELAQFFDSFKF